ncbi:MAG: hypothetical protein AB7L09_12670 [Nitrospira sp.]
MKTIAAWAGGVATFVMLTFLFEWLGDHIGVPVVFDLGYTRYISDRYGDYETDRQVTSFGLCIVIITWMIAIRVGLSIKSKSLSANLGDEGNLQFACWLFGLSVLAILMALIYLAFRNTYGLLADITDTVLQFSAASGVYWSVKSFYEKQLEKLKMRSENVDY